jgi:DNA modification methylase
MSDNLLYYGDPGAPGLAYLANMAPRLVELRRVLKPTGSLYLDCDSTAQSDHRGVH